MQSDQIHNQVQSDRMQFEQKRKPLRDLLAHLHECEAFPTSRTLMTEATYSAFGALCEQNKPTIMLFLKNYDATVQFFGELEGTYISERRRQQQLRKAADELT